MMPGNRYSGCPGHEGRKKKRKGGVLYGFLIEFNYG